MKRWALFGAVLLCAALSCVGSAHAASEKEQSALQSSVTQPNGVKQDEFDRLLITLIKTMLPRAETTKIDPKSGQVSGEKITGMPKFSTIKTPHAMNVVRNRNLVENSDQIPDAILHDEVFQGDPNEEAKRAAANLPPLVRQVHLENIATPGCGTTMETAAKSCLHILQTCKDSTSRAYWLQTSEGPVQLYCDMTEDGGGWALIGKVNAGDYVTSRHASDEQYLRLMMNALEDVDPGLLMDPLHIKDDVGMSWLSRGKTNFLFQSAEAKVVRVDLEDCSIAAGTGNNQQTFKNSGRYFQKRQNPPANWDFWNALRDATKWVPNWGGSEWITPENGLGQDLKVTKGSRYWNSGSNDFQDMNDGSFGVWSTAQVKSNDGNTYQVTRTCGLLNDGVDNSEFLYLMTCEPNANNHRWKKDEPCKSLVWLK